MKRRDILRGVGMAAAAAGLAACGKAGQGEGATVADEGPRQWKMVTSWPTNFPGLGTGAARLAERDGHAFAALVAPPSREEPADD